MPTAGPKGSFLFGNLPDFGKDPLGFLERCQREYGEFVPLRFFHKPVRVVSDPALVEQVLGSKGFRKTIGYRTPMMRRLFGQGLLTSEGELWTRQRRLAQPAFHRDRISSYARIIVKFTEDLCAEWTETGDREVHASMMRLTASVVTKSLFSADLQDEISGLTERASAILERFTTQWSGFRMLLNLLPSASKRRFNEAIDHLNAQVHATIRERRASGEDRGDLLSMLLKVRDETGQGMSDQQLRDEVVTLMAAGLDTTALTLSWGLYLLALHPRIQEEAAIHCEQTLEGRVPGFDDLARLDYAQRIVKESMRLYPPAWIIGRESIEDVELNGQTVKKGTSFMLSQWLTHRNERFFPEPLKFSPDRWLRESSIPKYAFFPFGGGPRICIGHVFATMEAVLVLAILLPRFRFSCSPDYKITPWPSITLQPKGGVRLRVAPRLVPHY